MRRRRLLGAVAVAAAAFGAGTGCARPAPRAHIVEIQGFALHPETLTVAVGDTVRWVNHDAVPHTATAGPDSARIFDSGSIAAGGEWSRVVTAGEKDYFCLFHPTMRGVLVVR